MYSILKKDTNKALKGIQPTVVSLFRIQICILFKETFWYLFKEQCKIYLFFLRKKQGLKRDTTYGCIPF